MRQTTTHRNKKYYQKSACSKRKRGAHHNNKNDRDEHELKSKNAGDILIIKKEKSQHINHSPDHQNNAFFKKRSF